MMTRTDGRRFPILFAAIAALALLFSPVQAQEDSAPAQPTGLSATASHDAITLTWDDPDDASITGYVILRRNRDTDEEGYFDELVADTGSAATTYTDDTVAAENRYTYRIKAINAYGVSERSRWVHIDTPAAPEPEEESAAEPPAQPTGLSATATHGRVVLTWDDPGNDSITGYVILRRVRVNDTGGDFSVLVADTGTAALTYTDNTVAASLTYTYRIKAINAYGVSERSRWVHIDTPAAPEPEEESAAEPPAQPTGLSATATHGRVVLTWDDPGNDSITGYVILRRVRVNDTGGDFSVLVADTGTAALTYTDNTVAASLTYTYRIKAINAYGVSERSRWVHIDTPAAPEPEEESAAEPPAQPTGLSATASHDAITLTWDDPDDASITGYVILRRNRDTDEEGYFDELVADTGSAATTYTDNTVAAENRYTYRIKAINAYGVSERSRWLHIATPAAPEPEEEPAAEPPDKPTGILSDAGHDAVLLSWTDPQDDSITGYRILRADVVDGVRGEFAVLSEDTGSAAASYTDDAVEPETSYVYRVLAINPGGVSDPSRDVEVSTPAAPQSTFVEADDPADPDGEDDPVGAPGGTRGTPPLSSICDRTAQVRDAIVAAIDGVSNCAEVTTTQLASVTGTFNLEDDNIQSLKPGDFSGLTALDKLWLNDNALTSLPAGVFSGLEALKSLDLHDNALSALPDDVFSGLTELTYLSLSGNALSALLDDVFSGLTKLTYLSLSRNALSALPDDVFSDLTALESLYLSRNTLSALPDDVFSDLTALTYLSLSRNALSALPDDVFSDLTALESLYLYDNALTSLPADVFSGLTALKLLWLYDNALESLRADVFSDLTALEKLRLNNALNNALTSLPAGVFSGLTALEELWLRDNALTSLPAGVFSGLTKLKTLWLHDNALTSLRADVFSGLTALEELLLRENALTSLPAGVFSGLTKLKTLWLHDNALTSLPAGVFSGLTKLKNLLLRENALTSLPAGVFSGLEELGLLDLSNNDLTSLPDGVFSGLEELRLLNLSHNPDTDDLLPLSVTLEHVGPNQVLAKVLAGAPLKVAIPVTLAGGVRVFTVEAGKVEGTVVTVTGISTEPVTGEISTQPSLDGPLGDHDHRGYIFVVVDVVGPARQHDHHQHG